MGVSGFSMPVLWSAWVAFRSAGAPGAAPTPDGAAAAAADGNESYP